MKRSWLFAAGCMMAVQPAAAQQKSASDIILQHKIPISRSAPDAYSGPGWERLIADGRQAQFFMIGEQHGVADIALFVKALHRVLATSGGYTHSALEVGPHSTDFAETLVRQGPGRLANYIAQPGHGFTIPFLFFAEEIALTEQIVARSPDKQKALWGLDQEFVGAAPIVVDLLRKRARSAGQHQAIDALAAKSTANPMLIGVLTPAELDPLDAAFAGDEHATALLRDLRLSSEIYAPFMRKTGPIYPANLTRENYMKVNFARRFAEAERRLGTPPKVFMKFGGYHAMRGLSGTDVPSLANFLAEWGLPRGFELVNMMVDCNGGESLNPQTSKPASCSPYFGKDSLVGQLATDEVTLIDLKALRPKLRELKDIDAKTRQTILAFDYYLTIRDPKAATPVGALPMAR
jgi:hypothetical protein